MRGGWIAVLVTLLVIGAVSAWEAWRREHTEEARRIARDRACGLALDDAAERNREFAKELDRFAGEEKALRRVLEAQRAEAVARISSLTLRGPEEDLLGPLRKKLQGRAGIDRIEVNRRADEERTAGWQEYAVRLRGDWGAVTGAIEAVHDLPVVVRVERLELRLDRTRRKATLDARVLAAVWSDPREVERARPELALAPAGGIVPTACLPLDLCRVATPDPQALGRFEEACAAVDARAELARRYRLIDSERDEVGRLRALSDEVAEVREESRASVAKRGAELLERSSASRRGYAGVDLTAEEGPVWLD